MFKHTKILQYNALPDKPDALMARRLQENLGGHWGELTGMAAYLFQGWNLSTPGNEKYKDLLLDTGTEEIGHIEMLATMIAHLLDDAPLNVQESAYTSGDPALAAVMGGMNPQHAIVNGLGASLQDANGNPWTSAYMESSGNLLADMRYNITRESMGRLQVTRQYHLTEDIGVRDMLSFLMARETQHQLQFMQVAKELEDKYGVIVPHGTADLEHSEFSHTLYNFSEGDESKEIVEGKIAIDGQPFKYEEGKAMSEKPFNKPRPEALRNTDLDQIIKDGRKIIENDPELK